MGALTMLIGIVMATFALTCAFALIVEIMEEKENAKQNNCK